MLRIALPLALVAGLVWLSPYRNEVEARALGLVVGDASANASSVIYLMGWEHALANLERTGGLGLGFNRMGCEPSLLTSVADLTEALGLGDANYNDGSFTFSKILSELGWLGLSVWVVLTAGFFVQLGRLGQRPSWAAEPAVAFAVCALASVCSVA